MQRILLLVLAMVLLIAVPAQASMPEDCATVTTRHYYALGTHNDYLVHDIQLCLSQTRKSLSYELPPLSQPLTLESTGGFTLSVKVVELESGEEVVREYGDNVTFSLPVQDGSIRYQMTVAVSNRSDGVIVGRIGGQEIGRILLIDFHHQSSDTLIIAFGGLSAEWWFAAQTEDTSVYMALIDQPTSTVSTDVEWNELPGTEGFRVVQNSYWRGRYLAIKAVFNH
jgi:hypothetical protein